MELTSFFDKLRGKNSDEEDENAKKANQFQQTLGRGAPNPEADEEGARELGGETPNEKLQNSQMVQGSMPFGMAGAGAAASEAGTAAKGLGRLAMPAAEEAGEAGQVALTPARQAAAAEQLRTQGYAHLFDENGKLVKTIGQDHPLGKKLMQVGQANKNAETAAAPGLSYSPIGAPKPFPGAQ